MQHILIIGQKFSTLTDYLVNHGFTYTFLQDRLKTKFPDKKFKHRILGDFTSRESLIASLEQLPHIDGVIATYENYILPAAWVANYLGIPGLPISAAEACTDKFIMRSLFEHATEKISPAFAVVSNEDDFIQFARSHSFPLILKPANLAKSLLVTKNHTIVELRDNYRSSLDLLQTTYKKYAPNRAPRLIIEEFLEGSIHSVDAFVDSDGNPAILDQIVDYETGYDIGYDDNFHYSRVLPSALSPADQSALRHCAEIGIRALGMKSSPAHVEIIMTTDGPRIVEIGARNGGYRERMHNLANGIDITGAAIALSVGEIPDLAAVKNESCAVLELFPKQPGRFVELSHIETLEKLSTLSYISVKAKKGDYVGKAAAGYKMAAVIILHGPEDAFEKDLFYIRSHVAVTTEATS
jgi:hypothetical protein